MIVRGPRPSDNFAQIHNAALADGRLSFKARGILAFLLSRPPGWKTSAERLARSGTDGERAVKSGLKELEAHGYLKRTRMHADGTDPQHPAGTWIHNQIITDQPATVPDDAEVDTTGAFCTDGYIPDTDLDTTGAFRTGAEQPDINNTDSTNTQSLAGDAAASPKVTGAATTTSRTDSRDGVGDPTPLPEKPSSSAWLNDAAWKRAHREIELQNIRLSVTKYEIRMKELNKQPSSSEWLRWLIEDEQKLILAERREAQERGHRKPWFAVAGD